MCKNGEVSLSGSQIIVKVVQKLFKTLQGILKTHLSFLKADKYY